MTDWHAPSTSGIPIRPTARVLLLDRVGCTLLFCAKGPDGRRFWFTPGGGADPEESAEAAALRELAEETGLIQVELEGEIWQRTVCAPFEGTLREIRERWFLVRVERFALDTSGFDQLERETICEHRWWTAAELQNSSERIIPSDLGERLAVLLRDGPPRRPMDISLPSNR